MFAVCQALSSYRDTGMLPQKSWEDIQKILNKKVSTGFKCEKQKINKYKIFMHKTTMRIFGNLPSIVIEI